MPHTRRFNILDWIERIGNKLPDPVTLFFLGAMIVLVGSELAVRGGWSLTHPANGQTITPRSLLTSDGMQWVWLNMIRNFTGFHPLGVVLVAMIGIGVAERTGLIGVLLKAMVLITPRSLLTPAIVLVGVMSSMATDAGYVVLPPLAAAVFARAGRAPMVGLAAVFAGVASGFSANLLLTGLDPLLQGLTQESAQLLDADYYVRADCNYFFMIASTFMITGLGWGVTHFIVERRFTSQQIAEQVAAANLPGGAVVAHGANGERAANAAETDRLTTSERRGMLAAFIGLIITAGVLLSMVLIKGGPLHGTYMKAGKPAPVWADAIVPLLFVLFLVPGIVYGVAAKSMRNDRDAARMMGESMAAMGPYIVLAFFAAQFVSWFGESNMGLMIAIEGVNLLQRFDLSSWQLVIAIVMLVAALNMFLGSASAKWALISPVFVPLFMGLGISPELTQAAYRVGDSCTNAIAPLNPYLVVILVFMQKYMPKAGLGSLISLMLPYTITFLIGWTALLLVWVALGIPLGPGAPLTYVPG